MKLLIVNPNTSQDVSMMIANTALKYASPSTVVSVKNPDSGPISIESVYDEMLSVTPTLDLLLSEMKNFDAFLLGCYAKHSVIEAFREISDRPVISIAEASIHIACMLGASFGILTAKENWVPVLKNHVRLYGLSDRCASIRAVGMEMLSCGPLGGEAAYQNILSVAKKMRFEDQAEVICLGSAGLTGMDKRLQEDVGIPVLDGIVCGLFILEGMNNYELFTSKHGSYKVPHRREVKNLPEKFSLPYRD